MGLNYGPVRSVELIAGTVLYRQGAQLFEVAARFLTPGRQSPRFAVMLRLPIVVRRDNAKRALLFKSECHWYAIIHYSNIEVEKRPTYSNPPDT